MASHFTSPTISDWTLRLKYLTHTVYILSTLESNLGTVHDRGEKLGSVKIDGGLLVEN